MKMYKNDSRCNVQRRIIITFGECCSVACSIDPMFVDRIYCLTFDSNKMVQQSNKQKRQKKERFT